MKTIQFFDFYLAPFMTIQDVST